MAATLLWSLRRPPHAPAEAVSQSPIDMSWARAHPRLPPRFSSKARGKTPRVCTAEINSSSLAPSFGGHERLATPPTPISRGKPWFAAAMPTAKRPRPAAESDSVASRTRSRRAVRGASLPLAPSTIQPRPSKVPRVRAPRKSNGGAEAARTEPRPAASGAAPGPSKPKRKRVARTAGKGSGRRGGASTAVPAQDVAAAALAKLRSREVSLAGKGFQCVVGVDEAGRGPLAGPVVAAACHIPVSVDLVAAGLADVTDSKKLGKDDRERLFAVLTSHPDVMWAAAEVSAGEIDRINILQASMVAMHKAVCGLKRTPDYVLIDGPRAPWGHPRAQRANGTWREADPPMPQGIHTCEPVVKGDAKVLAIAAASIIAKVTRDRIMDELDAKYPGYGFAQHAGYPTRAHVAAIARQGPTPVHRMTFAPLKHRK